MIDMARLESDTSTDEGEKARPYKDPLGLWSFGDGRCLETHPLSGSEWKALLDRGYISVVLSPAGSGLLRSQQLAAVSAALAHDYSDFWPALNDARQNALAELAFQIGVAGEEDFHDMLTAVRVAVRTGDWAPVKVAGLASKWARQTPPRAEIVLDQLCSGQFAPGR
jgi:GH24 family phage-related lysozyme (muramidase)